MGKEAQSNVFAIPTGNILLLAGAVPARIFIVLISPMLGLQKLTGKLSAGFCHSLYISALKKNRIKMSFRY